LTNKKYPSGECCQKLKANIKLDRVFQSLVSTMRETPGRRWLDKGLTKELLDMTDFEHKKVRDLHLYVRPLEGELMQVEGVDKGGIDEDNGRSVD